MTTQPFQLDPEVEHILQEVARDPRSSLLRVERPKVIRGLLEREPRVGVATAGLTTAERHLVQTRRAETAFALRVLCLQALSSDPRGEHLFSRQGVIPSSRMEEAIAAVRTRWMTASPLSANVLGADQELAVEALVTRSRTTLPFLAWSSAAIRLEPTGVSRRQAAQWLIMGSEYRSALPLLMSESLVPMDRRADLNNCTSLGLAYNRLGDLRRSLDWYRRAAASCSSATTALAGMFIVAAQIGDEREFMRSAQLLEQLCAVDDAELQWQCRAQRARRAEFMGRLTEDGEIMLRRLKVDLGPVSRSLADALA